MTRTVASRGTGRRDYSQVVEKVYQTMPIPSPTTDETIGKQIPLWWSSEFDMNGLTIYDATIYTVPTGIKMPIYYARFSIPSNTLIHVHLLDGNNASFAASYGYGTVEIPIPNGFTLSAGGKLKIRVTNWDTSTRTLGYYIQAIRESVD